MKVDRGFHPRFDSFRALMPNRVRQILLVSTLYDAFVLEEDGPLGEKIWDQYVEMRLTMVPRLRRVSNARDALDQIETETIDLVIVMTRLPDADPTEFAEDVKRCRPDLPVILIVGDPSELKRLPPPDARKSIDKVFLWNNDPQLFLAIIKFVEDRLNVDHDTKLGGVRVILLVEDSITYYSAFLPALYRSIVELTRNLMAQGLNNLHRQLRLRLRAKVLLAETYEEAVALFEMHRPYMLGVISDVKYWRGGRQDEHAGFDLAQYVREQVEDLPLLLQSSESEGARDRAHALDAEFLDKNSPSLIDEFRTFLSDYMGFGDFVFRMPDGTPVAKARTIDDLAQQLRSVPAASLVWHAERNHFSHWLVARAEVRIASLLRPRKVTEFDDPEGLRKYIIGTIEGIQTDNRSDVVSQFSASQLSRPNAFMHLGEGSMGGKGRGIAFLRYLLARSKFPSRYPDVQIDVPQTVVIGADEFLRFLESNNLRRAAMRAESIDDLAPKFLAARLHRGLTDNLSSFVRRVRGPLAVRSSSLLEDSHLQPFAGLYTTTMVPNNAANPKERLAQLRQAIKLVWLSTFTADSKAYFKSTAHRLEDEQMAVVIQRVVGRDHGDLFYPTYSGVAQSYNFYPVSHMRPEDGVAEIALGLGKTVVEGGASVRFCPAYPGVFPQYPRPQDWLKSSQRQFYALQLGPPPDAWIRDPDATLEHCDLVVAERHGELDHVASTFSVDDLVIRDSLSYKGPRIVSFAPVLKYDALPLPALLVDLLQTCQDAFGCPVEIEFAGNLGPRGTKPTFSLLQVRPFITTGNREQVEVTEQDLRNAWCQTFRALGNGVRDDLYDIVYVRRDAFDRARTLAIAEEIGALNHKLVRDSRPYILIGFGRWGSSDPWLGIGVTWAQIAGVGVFVEAGLPDFNVDPSQGTHFFQNLTSLGVGFLSVPANAAQAAVDWDWLEAQPIHELGKHVCHVRLDTPAEVRIDGRSGRAAILPPRA